ncbi:MAG: hypothetical protein LBF27_28575 [Sphingobacterium sp.]|jgi:hypothetical protein|nr:hypothetical protein [Sphingobacterium sp.]
MNCFLNFNILANGDVWTPNNRKDFDIVTRNCSEIAEIFEYFPDCTLFYNGAEIKRFIEDVKILGDLIGVDVHEINRLQDIMNGIGVNWEDTRRHSVNHNYIILLDEGYKTRSVSNSSIGECSEYKMQLDHGILINIFGCLDSKSQNVDVLKREFDPPNEIRIVRFEVLKNKPELITYFLHNSRRVFNSNEKHGENRQVVIKRSNNRIASPLRCSEEEAKNLLKRAVGIKGARELYYFDNKYKEFIEFKDENTLERSFHAYHPHNQNDIPKKVKDFIMNNYKLIEDIFREDVVE